VVVVAWNVDAVGAGVWHAIDSMASLAPPCIHSADEIALVASKSLAIVEDITQWERNAAVWNCGSFDFSHEVLGKVINYLLSYC